MKVIIAGSRVLNKAEYLDKAMIAAFNKWMSEDQEHWQKYYRPEIVSGGANGVDFLGEQMAKRCMLQCTVFPADWDKYGKSAGYKRNIQMAEYADALIAVWDGKSKGTKHMIDIMEKMGKPTYIYVQQS